jgi:hypothetical protein
MDGKHILIVPLKRLFTLPCLFDGYVQSFEQAKTTSYNSQPPITGLKLHRYYSKINRRLKTVHAVELSLTVKPCAPKDIPIIVQIEHTMLCSFQQLWQWKQRSPMVNLRLNQELGTKLMQLRTLLQRLSKRISRTKCHCRRVKEIPGSRRPRSFFGLRTAAMEKDGKIRFPVMGALSKIMIESTV